MLEHFSIFSRAFWLYFTIFGAFFKKNFISCSTICSLTFSELNKNKFKTSLKCKKCKFFAENQIHGSMVFIASTKRPQIEGNHLGYLNFTNLKADFGLLNKKTGPT